MNPQVEPEVINTVARFCQVGMRLLTARALTWTSMLITASLFAFCVYDPNPLRLASSTVFGLLVFWRVTWLEKTNKPKGDPNG